MIEVAAEYKGEVQRAMLVGLASKDDDFQVISEQLDELAELVKKQPTEALTVLQTQYVNPVLL